MTFGVLSADAVVVEPALSEQLSSSTPETEPSKGSFKLKRAPKEPKSSAKPSPKFDPPEVTAEDPEQSPEQSPESGLESVLTPTVEWFRSMLRGFLMTYVVGLASVLVWLRTPTSNARLWIVVALSIPVAYQLLLRPVNRRIALRGIARRPSTLSTAVAVAIAAAVLATSVTIADSVSRTSGVFARRHLGPVDALVFASSETARLQFLAAVERQEAALSNTAGTRRSGTTSTKESTDGRVLFTSSRVGASSPTVSSIAGIDAIEVAFEELEAFGNEPSSTGLSGIKSLSGQMVYLGADLASDLDAKQGTQLTVSIGGVVQNFTVERVLPRVGMAALSLDGRPRPRVMFVPRGGISGASSETSGLVRYVTAYSVSGRSAATWRQSRTLADLLTQAIEGGELPTESAPDAASGISEPTKRIEANAVAVKADLRDFELRGTGAFTSVASGLSTIAGIGAVASLIAALVLTLDRRRRELASLRSVGLSRSDTLGAVTIELWLISLGSIVVGSVVGWLLGAIALGRSTVGSTAFQASSAVSFPVRVAALSTSIAAAAAVAMATIFLVAFIQLRTRKQATNEATNKATNTETKRTDESPTLTRSTQFRLALACVVGVALLARGVWKQSGVATVVGSFVLAIALDQLVKRKDFKHHRSVRSSLVVGVLAATLLTMFGVRSGSFGAGPFGFISGVLLVGGCVIAGWFGTGVLAMPKALQKVSQLPRKPVAAIAKPLKSVWQKLSTEVFERLSDDKSVEPTTISAPLRATIVKSQKDRRPIHATIVRVLSAFGVFSAVVSSILSSSVQQGVSAQAADSKGRFQAVVRSDDPGIDVKLRNRVEVSEVSILRSRFGSLSQPGVAPIRSTLASLDESYSAAPGVARLTSRLPEYPTDREAFLALLSDPTLAMVSEASLQGLTASKAVGSPIFLADDESGLSSSMTIIGVHRSTAGLADVLIGPDALDRLRGNRPVSTSGLVSFATGVDQPSAIASFAPNSELTSTRSPVWRVKNFVRNARWRRSSGNCPRSCCLVV